MLRMSQINHDAIYVYQLESYPLIVVSVSTQGYDNTCYFVNLLQDTSLIAFHKSVFLTIPS